MPRPLTRTEEALVELVHLVVSTSGQPVTKVKRFLLTEVERSGRSVVEHLDDEGSAFVNRLKAFLNSSD